MTVVTASTFFWFGEPEPPATEPEPLPAVVVAADRMLTDSGLGIEYETSRWKGMAIGPRHLVLIAGDLSFHSDALGVLKAAVPLDGSITGWEIAHKLSDIMIGIRHMRATDTYLRPIGLNQETFLARQGSLSSDLVLDLSHKMQNYVLEVEAMVVGQEGRDAALFRIDERGIITNHIDVGFLSIGAGGIHSSAHFMQMPYNHAVGYYPALWNTFLAKKRAEVAPGVGGMTDIFRMTKDGALRVPDGVVSAMERLYQRQKKAYAKASERWVARLIKAEQEAILAMQAKDRS